MKKPNEQQLKLLKELQKKQAKPQKDKEPKQPQRKYTFNNLLKTLKLNENQQKAIKQFFEDFRDASEKLREKRGNPKQMQEKMQKLFMELIEKIKSQLDDDQKKKLENWQKKDDKAKEPGRREHPRRNMPERPENPDKPAEPVK